MRKTWIFSCFILLSVLWCLPINGQQLASYAKDGVIRVKLDPAVAEQLGNTPRTRGGIVSTGIQSFDAVNKEIKAVNMKRVFPYAPKFEERMRKHGLHLWYEISYDEKLTPEQAVNRFKGISGIKIAEIVRVQTLPPSKTVDVTPTPQTRATLPFNDPLLVNQWHYANDGSIQGSIAGCDINLYKAWEITAGARNVIVAIIDGGIDITHEDLIDNLWVNEAELNGEEGVDDDGDGYIDDIYGYNFAAKSPALTAHKHGTHVAGTVAAVNNNGKGVCGVAGGTGNKDGVLLMSCQVFDDYAGQGDFATPFVYAANKGAVIAQCSWGWDNDGYVEQAVLDAMDYFTQEAGNYEGSPMKGGLCIFAAGNTGLEGTFYPGAYATAVSVTALSVDYKVASYSSRGDWADVSAPGGDVELGGESWGVLSTFPGNRYGYYDGTSMACPHVSGIAALIIAKYGGPDFTNTDLRNRLTESVHDIYGYNPQYIGKLGSGIIDAYMALDAKNNNAPAKIADFTLVASQEDIQVEYLLPSDPDNDNIAKGIAYYSDKAFTATSDLSVLKSVEIATRFNKTGDKITINIPGLKPETEYWVAVKAFDRWQNGSELSEVKTIVTNAGPDLELSKTDYTIEMDVTQSYTAKDSIVLNNTGEGLLKWNASIRSYYKDPWSIFNTPGITTASATTKKQPKTYSFKGIINTQSVTPTEVIESGYNLDEYPKEFQYYKDLRFYIGEGDTALTNSMAQYFFVDPTLYPEGFNLTGFYVEGVYTQGRPIVEVYSGEGGLTPEGLLLSDTLDAVSPFSHTIRLSEDIMIPSSNDFWLVFHMPKGNAGCLGTGDEYDYSNAHLYSYYSSNMGKTWHTLGEVLSEGNLSKYADLQAWSIKAVSQTPGWIEYLTLNPSSGIVRPHDKQAVIASPEKVKLINGDYNFKLYLNTNCKDKEKLTIPGTLSVKGHKPDLKSAKVIDFGKTFVGKGKEVIVEIFNNGYGKFAGQGGYDLYDYNGGYSFSDNHFNTSGEWGDGVPIPALEARSTSRIKLKFTPTYQGIFNCKFTLNSETGETHNITLTGTAINPAHITIAPTQIVVGDLDLNAAPTVKQITISNTGSYPLEFAFPKFTEDTVAGITKTSHKYGYEYISNIPGFNKNETCQFRWDELLNTTEIQNLFDENTIWTEAVNIGFKFPFFGKDFEQVYIGKLGILSFSGETGSLHACMPASTSCSDHLDLITPMAYQLSISPRSKIAYAKQNGKFVVSFENVGVFNADGDGETDVSFRIALSPNGDVEMFYKDYDPFMISQPQNIFIGCIDYEVKDPFVITDVDMVNKDNIDIWEHIQSGTAIKIVAPGKNMIRDIDKKSGTVAINEIETVNISLAADSSMYKGDLTNLLVLLSNDPNNSTSIIRLDANITGDYYQPVVELDRDTLLFGEVFQTGRAVSTISLLNKGNAPIEITRLEIADPTFTYTVGKPLPFTLEAGTSEDIYITAVSTTKGSYESVMSVTTAGSQILTTRLFSTIIDAPDIEITPAQYAETLESGKAKQLDMSIKNTGESILKYSITPTTILYPVNDTLKANESLDYIYSSSIDDDNILYQWEDITDSPIHYKEEYFYTHVSFEQELPFEFTFYGKTYNKIYVYGPGFITFKKFPAVDSWPEDFSADFTPYIAPYWGHHTPSPAEYALDPTQPVGIYYKAEDDRVIVSFIDFSNQMSLGLCFQAILYKNGNIKFQYKLLEGGIQWSAYGINGLAYEGAEESQRLTLRSRYLNMSSAIEFYPVKTSELQPNETANLKMEASANGLLAGTYQTTNLVKTNVPTKPEITVPLNLTVTGTPSGEWPEELALPDIFIESYPNNYVFTFRNVGTAAYHITGLTWNEQSQYDPNDWQTPFFPTFDVLYWSTQAGGGVGPLNVQPRNQGDWASGLYVPINEFNPLEVGKEAQKFAVSFLNTMDLMEVTDTLVFTTDLPGYETIKIPLKYNIVEAPVIEVNPEKMDLYAPDKHFSTDTNIRIINNGNYKLDYKVSISYNDEVNALTAIQAANDISLTALGLDTKVKNASFQSLPVTRATGEYTDSLGYDFNLQGQMIVIGTATGEDPYIACTEFTAPEGGFNMSKIKFMASLGEQENAEFIIEVRTGSSFNNNTVAGRASKVITGGPEAEGDRISVSAKEIEFENPVYIYPNEKFWVYIYIPEKAFIAFVPTKDVATPLRYMLKLKGEWADVTELSEQYGSLGFLTLLYQQEAGSSWITLNTETGTVAAHETEAVNFHVDASKARNENNNKAIIKIASNDPENPEVSIPVTLNKNTAPVITRIDKQISVKEEQETTARFTVVDNENDNFEVTVEDESGIATLNEDNGNVSVTLAPKYGDNGNHTFTLKAKDVFDNASTLTVDYYVEKVNRAPIVILQPTDKTQKVGDIIESLILSSVFSDPDGDELSYTAHSSNPDAVKALVADGDAIEFVIKAEGEAIITLTAQDPALLQATTTFKVTVEGGSNGSGIFEAQVKAYPNPTSNILNVQCSDDVEGEVIIRLYDMGGNMVYTEKTAMTAGSIKAIDITALPAGMYVLEVEHKGAKITSKVVKQ